VRKQGAAAAANALPALLKDPSPPVRIMAAESLCWIGHANEGLSALTDDLSLADPMQGLHILLDDRLPGYTPHPGAFDGLTDARRIIGIIFLALHIRFNELWRHQFHPMAQFGKLPRPVMGPT